MELNKVILSLLICLQLISTTFLWSLNAADVISEVKFAVFLAIDLLCFAMVAYSYRKLKRGVLISPVWILLGSIGLIVLLFSGLFFP
jgi:hypothetical protein